MQNGAIARKCDSSSGQRRCLQPAIVFDIYPRKHFIVQFHNFTTKIVYLIFVLHG